MYRLLFFSAIPAEKIVMAANSPMLYNVMNNGAREVTDEYSYFRAFKRRNGCICGLL